MGPLALSQWQNQCFCKYWLGLGTTDYLSFDLLTVVSHTTLKMVSQASRPSFLAWFKIDFYVVFRADGFDFSLFGFSTQSLKCRSLYFCHDAPNFSPLLNWDVRKLPTDGGLEGQLEQTQLLDFNSLHLPESVSPNPSWRCDNARLFWALGEGHGTTGNLAHMRQPTFGTTGFFSSMQKGLQSNFYAKRARSALEFMALCHFTRALWCYSGFFQAGRCSDSHSDIGAGMGFWPPGLLWRHVSPVHWIGSSGGRCPLCCHQWRWYGTGERLFSSAHLFAGSRKSATDSSLRECRLEWVDRACSFAANSVMKQIQFTLRGVATLSSVRS